MISTACIKKFLSVGLLALLGLSSVAQVTSGKITFERKTNLKKIFKDDPRMSRFITEDTKAKVEDFELYFTESSSAFFPVESDEPEQGFMKYLTTHNTIYKDLVKQEKLAVLDMWGTETYVRDAMVKREWKITDNKRRLGGYMCRKAFWEMNDSTRIYAWFSPDLVPSIGPEGFDGLPGAILGLATEDGSIIYFAKEVELLQPPAEKMTRNVEGKDVYTVEKLKEILLEKMGKWVKKDDLDAMFSWL